MEKVKNFLCSAKAKVVGVASAVGTTLVCAVPCFAADESGVSAVMSTSLGAAKTEMLGVVAVIAPIGIAICVAMLVYKRGLGFFKSMTKG